MSGPNRRDPSLIPTDRISVFRNFRRSFLSRRAGACGESRPPTIWSLEPQLGVRGLPGKPQTCSIQAGSKEYLSRTGAITLLLGHWAKQAVCKRVNIEGK